MNSSIRLHPLHHPLRFLPSQISFPSNQVWCYSRRRAKRTVSFKPPRCLFDSFLQLPFDITPIAVSVISSGITLFVSSHLLNRRTIASSDEGEWILLTSPTPFNQFAIRRCPSVFADFRNSIQYPNERLVQDGHHFVQLNNGRVGIAVEVCKEEDEFEYQRVCISTKDGGVVSLDWPAELDLGTENGLEATVLLISGTPLGSLDAEVRSFVSQALRNGIFPIVMNPRGCAGSPLTTARLLTAADSDDINTAVEFVSKARSWTTMLAVGWGYGATMLTKYLAEVGERTPFTAATCVNNLFDLEEVTRTPPFSVALDEKLAKGLVDILLSNKVLFQGRSKGFDVEKALTVSSVREFDNVISMVSYGFDRIEEFYSMCRTFHLIGNLKIPVLFIHSDDGTVPLQSIPRNSIAENPFTSLLLCPYESKSFCDGGVPLSWCHKFAIEWLTAVELSFLKGLHPLVKGLTPTNGSENDLTFPSDRVYRHSISPREDVNVLLSDDQKNLLGSLDELHETDNGNMQMINLPLLEQDIGISLNQEQYNDLSGSMLRPADSAPGTNEQDCVVDATEHGQVQQAAQVVMNMLDLTMPGMLKDEGKRKVLSAVAEGETIIQALHGVVPEEARGKIANSVSAVLKTQQSNIHVSKLLGIRTPWFSEGMESKTSETIEGPKAEQVNKGNTTISLKENASPLNVSINCNLDESKTVDGLQSTAANHLENASHVGINQESSDAMENTFPLSDEKDSGTSSNGTTPEEKQISAESSVESGIFQKEILTDDSSTKYKKVIVKDEDDGQLTKGSKSLSDRNVKNNEHDDKVSDPSVKQNEPASVNTSTTGFNVVQALDAITGMDDSTQVAVNSVFSVIEDIISRIEDEDSSDTGRNDDESTMLDSKTSDLSRNRLELEKQVEGNADVDVAALQMYQVESFSEGIHDDATSGAWFQQKLIEGSMLYEGNGTNGEVSGSNRHLDLDATTTLLLDYIPEEGQWKLLDDNSASNKRTCAPSKVLAHKSGEIDYQFSCIAPAHYLPYPNVQKGFSDANFIQSQSDGREDRFSQFVEKVVIRALKVAIVHKVGVDVFKQMDLLLYEDIEHIATAASFPMGSYKDAKIDNLIIRDRVVRAMATAYQETKYLRKMLPVSIVIASSIAALRRYLNVKSKDDNYLDIVRGYEKFSKDKPVDSTEEAISNQSVMSYCPETDDDSFKPLDKRENVLKSAETCEETVDEKDGNNIVANLAEKAMLVAAPVVPTTEDGEVDQDRLVAMLADLGKKGGALRFVGKIALLWGGIRGAMSLTDRLISFLHIADRPLYQRVFGFFCLVLVIWSPFVVPFVPTLVQSWINNTPRGFADLVCISGLYTAIMVLVTLWGRRIRCYEDPLKQYGLDLSCSGLLKGFIAGVGLVLSILACYSVLGFVQAYWPSRLLPLSIDVISLPETYGHVMAIVNKAIVSTGVVLVEEVFFRSWLVDEIAAELGYHRGIMISAIAFALLKRSPWALPCLWLLSLALVGTRQQSGSLSIAIGLRTGIKVSNFAVQTCGFFVYNKSLPVWIIGAHRLQPFDGVVGIPFAALLAVFLYLKPMVLMENQEAPT